MSKELSIKYLSYPTPVFCIGTYNPDGRANLMTAVLGGMCSHRPPLFAVSLRSATQSHANILERKAFTVNVPSAPFVHQVDFVGLVSGRDTDKFVACGLTAERGSQVDAPYVGEFPTVAECEVRHTLELGSHTMFVGEIVTLRGDDRFLTEIQVAGSEYPDIPDMAEACGLVLVVHDHQRSYMGIGKVHGQAYSIGRSYIKK